jgi:hypothetical protein
VTYEANAGEADWIYEKVDNAVGSGRRVPRWVFLCMIRIVRFCSVRADVLRLLSPLFALFAFAFDLFPSPSHDAPQHEIV